MENSKPHWLSRIWEVFDQVLDMIKGTGPEETRIPKDPGIKSLVIGAVAASLFAWFTYDVMRDGPGYYFQHIFLFGLYVGAPIVSYFSFAWRYTDLAPKSFLNPIKAWRNKALQTMITVVSSITLYTICFRWWIGDYVTLPATIFVLLLTATIVILIAKMKKDAGAGSVSETETDSEPRGDNESLADSEEENPAGDSVIRFGEDDFPEEEDDNQS